MIALRKKAGERLFRLAVTLPRGASKAAIRAALPARHKRMSKAAAVALVAEIVAELDRLRYVKRMARPRRGWRLRGGAWAPRFYALPSGPLEERLRARVSDAFRMRAGGAIRMGAAGGHSFAVLLTTDPAAVAWRVRMSANRDTYKGRHKGREALEDHHTVALPRGWIRRVYRRGLAVVDGLPTLDAAPLVSPLEGVELYAVTYAQQGRGYDVHTRRGYLARRGGDSYHGDTVAATLAGLARKSRGPRKPVDVARAVDRLADRHGDVIVTPSDAYAVGACAYGVAHWRHRVGLDTVDRATVAQVAAAWREHPAPEAVAAMRHAIRCR